MFAEEYAHSLVVHNPLVNPPSLSWQAPPAGMIKLNVDASLQVGQNFARCGVVARDNTGKALLSSCHVMHGVDNALQAEFMAILFGVQTAKDFHFNSIMVESDCQNAISEILKGKDSFSEWFPLIQDIIYLQADFLVCDIAYASKHCNRLADSICRCDYNDYAI